MKSYDALALAIDELADEWQQHEFVIGALPAPTAIGSRSAVDADSRGSVRHHERLTLLRSWVEFCPGGIGRDERFRLQWEIGGFTDADWEAVGSVEFPSHHGMFPARRSDWWSLGRLRAYCETVAWHQLADHCAEVRNHARQVGLARELVPILDQFVPECMHWLAGCSIFGDPPDQHTAMLANPHHYAAERQMHVLWAWLAELVTELPASSSARKLSESHADTDKTLTFPSDPVLRELHVALLANGQQPERERKKDIQVAREFLPEDHVLAKAYLNNLQQMRRRGQVSDWSRNR